MAEVYDQGGVKIIPFYLPQYLKTTSGGEKDLLSGQM